MVCHIVRKKFEKNFGYTTSNLCEDCRSGFTVDNWRFPLISGKTFLVLLAITATTTGFWGLTSNNSVYAAATISVASSGAQSIDVMPDASGNTGTAIGVDEITVNTNCRAGYNFSMSTSVNDNNLYLNGNVSNNTSGTYFSPATGSSTLTNSPNTWGYYYNSSAPTTAPTSGSTFSAVPALSGSAAVIKTTAQTASASDISDSFNIYYGVAMANSLAPGTYKMIPDTNNFNVDGSIVYYVTMDSSCEINTITYNANSGSGTISPQEVQNGSSVALADNAFTRNNYYFKGWSTNQSATTPQYRPGQVITSTSDLTLYAIWGSSANTSLYNMVASLTKGTQTAADLQAVISKDNSGVYTYNTSVFGTASDSANTSNIYYYRGILDTNLDDTTATYGSNGNSMNYPNYVRIGDICWRIVRTTGSGGVKMIYNGLYSGGTTANSCANAQANAQLTTAYYNRGTPDTSTNNYATIGFATYVGYNYNSSYGSPHTGATSATANSTVFNNGTASNIRKQIETWYKNNIRHFTNISESSAGFCNDRTTYASTTGSATTTTIPYSTTDAIYFGPYVRNYATGGKPTLTCPNTSGNDLLTTSSGLGQRIALITADEAALAGNGLNGRTSATTNSSNYSYSSYLRSGSTYYLLSPSDRVSSGATRSLNIHADGYLYRSYTSTDYGVRPAISLVSGTTVASGSGTATNPWVVTEPPQYIYDKVARQSKGTQTAANLQSTITASNSGVYEYDSSVFGTSSDASNSNKIYYYRGILDTTTGTYGSNGDGAAYPNYVILDADGTKTTADTCWRIIRTTGSGGVKMIYNGKWTGSTCANATTATQLSSTSTFSGTSTANSKQIVRVGYTYNATYASTSSTGSTTYTTVMGSDSSYSNNSTNSTVKGNVETWYSSNLSSYTSILETNANYCNDRQSFTTSTGTTGTSSIRPYVASSTSTGATYVAYFAGYQRNDTTAKTPSLGCPRSTVDRYSTSTSGGGNGQLSSPVALITADEASFAGSGSATAANGSAYNANSYLRTGSAFWTMTPYNRVSQVAYGFRLGTNGALASSSVVTTNGVRPVISLKENVTIAGGTGVATNPWVIRAP